MIKANISHGTTAREKEKLLTEHISTRTGHKKPHCVTCVTVFCDELLLSGPTDGAGLVSIEVQGYVQTNHAKPLSTMKKWIDYASWSFRNKTKVLLVVACELILIILHMITFEGAWVTLCAWKGL